MSSGRNRVRVLILKSNITFPHTHIQQLGSDAFLDYLEKSHEVKRNDFDLRVIDNLSLKTNFLITVRLECICDNGDNKKGKLYKDIKAHLQGYLRKCFPQTDIIFKCEYVSDNSSIDYF